MIANRKRVEIGSALPTHAASNYDGQFFSLATIMGQKNGTSIFSKKKILYHIDKVADKLTDHYNNNNNSLLIIRVIEKEL